MTAGQQDCWIAGLLDCRSEGFPRTGICYSWVREGRGPGQDPGGHAPPPSSSSSPPALGGRWNQHFGTFSGPKQMLDAPLCREFRSETDASSEIIQIKAKMKVGWKSLNSQRQAENFRKIIFFRTLGGTRVRALGRTRPRAPFKYT